MITRKNTKVMQAVACGLALSSNANANTFFEQLEIEPSGRYRYQQVQDQNRGDASASTLALRITAAWDNNHQWSGLAQYDHVHGFNRGNFNSVTENIATSPISDVPSSELNQFWMQYSSETNWLVKVGRQHLNFDNERHISSVEFWQNDQTFDAVLLHYADGIKWDFNYAYLTKVHRIFSDDAGVILPESDPRFETNPIRPFSELGNHDHNSHMFNLSYAVNPYVSLTGYAYLLNNSSARQFSSDTFGMRIEGQIKPEAIKYGYSAEIAHQQTSSSSPWDYNGFYFSAEVSAQYKSHEISITHERLSQDNGLAFVTSLGNNHLFLGWADVFQSYANAQGLTDTFVTYRGRSGKLRWRALLHQFNSASSGRTIGYEVDLEVAYRYTRDWEFTFIAAMFFTDNGIDAIPSSQEDLTSLIVSASYKF
ncbi:alginate export family protein [Glaciecola sp. 1036]|uniref:alginate export family protein n=1 Tax=Alteromonadaceae TaxID=72275 RepID=UPI003CFDB3F1